MRNRHAHLFRRLSFVLAISLCLFAQRGFAGMKVLTVPEHPLLLFFEHTKGIIQKAYLRSPNGVRSLEQIEGLLLLSDSFMHLKTDIGLFSNLVWRIDFRNPRDEETVSLWITSVTETATAWLAIAPSGKTLWDEFPVPLTCRDNIFLYIAPQLPAYNGEPGRSGPDIFSFVYTLLLTKNGPKLVAVPEIYRRFLPLSSLAVRGEEDDELRRAYTALNKDFERMSEGRMPSREAMNNFQWRRIMTVRWKR